MLQRIIIMVLGLLANLIGLDTDLHDPTLWFAGEGALAVVVIAAVVFLRKQVNISGIAVIFVSIGIGAGFATLGYFADLFADGTGIAQALLFGIASGIGASVGWDFLAARKTDKLEPGKATPTE